MVRGIGERQEERETERDKCYEQYYHNLQNRPATTRPKTLPIGLLCSTQRERERERGRSRTIADGAQVVA